MTQNTFTGRLHHYVDSLFLFLGEYKMKSIEIVKAYFAALDSADTDQADQYLSEDYQLVDFTASPMDKEARLGMVNLFKAALPNLNHSLSNIRVDENTVKLTVQLSGTNSGHLDLRNLGIGVIPRTHKFIIFPNENYELTIIGGKIAMERDISPRSPGRRMSGRLKALGVNNTVV
jgi:predicted ester cyclase